MKTLIITLALLASFDTQARVGGSEGTGGGDLCEDRIKVIRDDIKMWIENHGHLHLILPDNVSSGRYSASMLEAISEAKIECVGAGDKGYPIQVENVPKVCRFDQTPTERRITCDLDKFNSFNESNQYILVHHELAGLAGVEAPSGTDSNYAISNQLSAYLMDTIVKKLAIKPQLLTADQFKPGIYSYGECNYRIKKMPSQNILIVSDAGCIGTIINPLSIQKAYCSPDLPDCSTAQFQANDESYTFEFVANDDGTVEMYKTFKFSWSSTSNISHEKLVMIAPAHND